MARSVLAYVAVVVLVVVAVIAIYTILNSALFSRIPTPIQTTAHGTTTAANQTPNQTVTTASANYTTSALPADCFSQNATVAIYNGNFSTGTFAGWNTTGVGFGAAPSNIIHDNSNGLYYGSPWTGYNGTFFATTYTGGTTVSIGNLTSDSFEVTEPYLNFKIISPQEATLYVEILENGTPFLVDHYNTLNVANASTFENASIPVVALLCKTISVKVVAGVVSERQPTLNKYIAVGDFYMGKAYVETPGILVNSTLSSS